MSQAQILPTDHFSPSISLIEGRPATTSLAIAEHFGKRHKDVLKSIRNLCVEIPEKIRERNFSLTFRTVAGPNNSERQEEFFTVYFDGFILLVMGYTGKTALQIKLVYISAFNAMRDELAARHEAAALPHGDTLSPAEQSHLHAIVSAKAGMLPADMQRKVRSEIWTRFNRHFTIARYAQLPPAKMGEAVEYLVGMEVKAQKALPTHAEQAAASALGVYAAQQAATSPIPVRILDQFPKDMGTGRREALKKIEAILKQFYGLRDTVRLFTSPGGYSMGRSLSEKEQYEILLNLYRSADANLAAAYNALEAGYRLGKEVGRV